MARRHLLLPELRTDDVPAISDELVALHSSDPVTVYLSAMLRMANPSLEAVAKALYDDRTVIRHHAMRRTLWVGTPPVVRLMHAAATRKLIAPERARTCKLLAANGVEDPETWLEDACNQVLEVLHTRGPLSARALGEQVPALRHPLAMAPGKSYASTASAHTRVLLQLGFEGKIVRTRPGGSWVNGAYTYAAMDSWLPGGLEGSDGLDEKAAATELARLWLRRFGPGTTKDLQWWMGWTTSLTRHALAACEAVQVDLDGVQGWLAADDEPAEPVPPWVAVLPSLDPTVMGWKEREWYLPEAAADAFDSFGNAGATIWVDGRVVGAWAQTKDGGLRTHYFEKVAASRRREAEARLVELAAMVGETRFTVRFPGRIHGALVG